MKNVVAQALSIIEAKGTILYPTDTIWGIGCHAMYEEAITKIFAIKGRSSSNPFILLVRDVPMLSKFLGYTPSPEMLTMLEQSQRPTTVIYPHAQNIPAFAKATDGSVGIRICRQTFCQKLLQKMNAPLVSTSANFSGEASPQNFAAISPALKQGIDFIVPEKNADSSSAGVASRIIKINENGEIFIIRD
ncbi:MAG: L-threonylcarbamoyladenylate synthase [Chitinophagales bacterium]|nr:threonylcarbamoyl-AMP synthase [Bacteroidota bacterium]MCB9043020.1 threonylcarbamoyl-AMP synthase [Chitinophagales bacterium]